MRNTTKQTTIVHLVPTWKLKPETSPTALCGAGVEVPDTTGHAGPGTPIDTEGCIVCALCELCQTFGDIPEPPESAAHAEQGKLF